MINHILAIGIDNYQNCTKLNNAVRDIENIVDVLINKYNFKEENTIKLLNENASSIKIIDELENFLLTQDSDHSLVILFSGHGDFDSSLQMGYIIPQEATPYSKSSYIPYSTLFNYIKALKSHHILLISDSCFSGSIFSPDRKIATAKEKLDSIPSKWAITSGRLETVLDGVPGKNSPFAEALIKILNDNQETLSVSELSNKIIAEVAEKVEQLPRGESLQMYGHKGGEFLFRRKQNKKQEKSDQISSNVLSIRKELLELIEGNYDLENKIEDAENKTNVGTVRRLNKEKASLKNILNKELLKELEIQHSRLQNTSLEDVFLAGGLEKYKQMIDIKKRKNEIVKTQKYEEAAILRNKEKELEKNLGKMINYKLVLSSDSLHKDYSICQMVMDIQNIKFDKRSKIEKFFGNILFLDLSFKNNKISNFTYKDERQSMIDNLMSELIGDNQPSLLTSHRS